MSKYRNLYNIQKSVHENFIGICCCVVCCVVLCVLCVLCVCVVCVVCCVLCVVSVLFVCCVLSCVLCCVCVPPSTTQHSTWHGFRLVDEAGDQEEHSLKIHRASAE